MKNMIERYVYDVTRRLPEQMRDDVSRELRSNIEDMLSDDPDDAEVARVLTELGSPAKLAVKYHPRPRYLISPELFDDYKTVLKVVAVTLAAILAAIAIFKFVFGDIGSAGIGTTVVTVITSFITGAFTGIVQAFFWVTLAFALFEYFGRKTEMKPWSPDKLPDVPVHAKTVIKRSDAIANAVFSILFTVVFLAGTLREPPFIAWYEAAAPTAPLFNAEIVQNFLPLYVFLMLLMLFVTVVKVIKGRWTATVAGVQMLYNLASAAVGIAFVSRPGIFTDAFIAKFADKVGITTETMAGYFDTGVTVLIVLMALGAFGEIASAVSKTAKGYEK